MVQRSTASLRVISDPRPPPVVPTPVLGMLIFVIAETMMFAGLISAFTIVKAGALGWPPPGQPRLPVEATAFNTAVLLLSAAERCEGGTPAICRGFGSARVPATGSKRPPDTDCRKEIV